MKAKTNSTLLIIIIILGCTYFISKSIQERQQRKVIVYSEPKYIHHRRLINTPSRGELPPYKNIGYISNNKENEDIKVLSLYGRPTYNGSNKWNYYTMHEGVRIPIENCGKVRGCNEKYNGDNIKVNEFFSDFNVQLYKDDAPRYIPY